MEGIEVEKAKFAKLVSLTDPAQQNAGRGLIAGH